MQLQRARLAMAFGALRWRKYAPWRGSTQRPWSGRRCRRELAADGVQNQVELGHVSCPSRSSGHFSAGSVSQNVVKFKLYVLFECLSRGAVDTHGQIYITQLPAD